MKIPLPPIGISPVPTPHFPTAHQAVIFRASEFVSFDRLARLLRTTRENIERTALQMGITEETVSDIWLNNGYITIIRSMWSLLPYSQLTELLGTDCESLARTLRDEDFLDIKLGQKPDCKPVIWRELTEDEEKATKHIADIMNSLDTSGVKPFDFKYTVPELRLAGEERVKTRMIYLFSGLYKNAFDVDSQKYCSDELLDAYRKCGINAVWTQGVLSSLTEFPFDPSYSRGYEARLERLAEFTKRLDKFGIRLFLYINEPRAMPESFFEKYPQLRGHERNKENICMCTSAPEVKAYLADAIERICKAAPLLGGFFTITRSENVTNCFSHSTPDSCTCPRCKALGVGRVIGDVIRCIREGADRVSRDIKVIAWSWAWNEDNLEIIENLPENVILQSQSELHIPFTFGGISGKVVDYSMSIIGPGERARSEWAAARRRGLEVSAKVQVNTSWECSTVPSLPVYPKTERHIQNVLDEGVSHLMLTWTLGGYPSIGLSRLARFFFDKAEVPSLSEAEQNATESFSAAFSEFPFDIKVLYNGPQNAGPSNLLYTEPTGYRATMTCYAYDDTEKWRSIYPPQVFEAQLSKLCEKWEEGLNLLERDNEGETAIMANAAYCCFRSSLNQFRFYGARGRNDRKAMLCEAKNELGLAQRMLKLMNKNAAIGFEAANHYYYSKRMLCEKILNCSYIINMLSD